MWGNTKQAGYTITELIIVVTIGAAVAIALVGASINLYFSMMRRNAEAELVLESQGLLRRVVEDIRTSAGIRSNNTIGDTNGPVGGWVTSNANVILVISSPSLDQNEQIIYDPLTGAPYLDEFIYFTEDTTLHKRILANPSATGNRASTTCPESLATPSCPSDVTLTNYFTQMNFVFYDQDDAITTDSLLTRSILITVDMQRRVFGADLPITNSIRMTMRNNAI